MNDQMLKQLAGEIIPSLAQEPLVLTEETPTVDKMLKRFETQWMNTADDCVRRAQELEIAAAELRNRADDLVTACNYLANVKHTVLFEIESRNRAASLALVNPSK